MPHEFAAAMPVLDWHDIETAAPPQVDWIWDGYVAAGAMTLLAGQWKAGKTTLLTALLGCMKGGGELAGRTVRAGKALVVTEEGPGWWRDRGRRHDLDGHVHWVCRPFRTRPTPQEWAGLLDQIAALHAQAPIDLLVIDPLAVVLPGRDENQAATMLDALRPLRELTSHGPAVLILHHTSKKASAADGRCARGSGALAAAVDVLMELHWTARAMEADRHRTLLAWSRDERTPRQLVIELSEDGRGYAALGDVQAAEYAGNADVLVAILSRVKRKVTRQAILERWPEGRERPDPSSLWHWLTQGVGSGRILRQGSGHKNDPYRYWLPESEARWAADKEESERLLKWIDEHEDALFPRSAPRDCSSAPVGPGAKAAEPSLIESLKDVSPKLYREALAELEKIELEALRRAGR